MKSMAKAWIGAGLLGTRLFRRMIARQAVIVAFHRVNDRTAGDTLTIGVSHFNAFCRLFREHFEVVPLAEILRRLRDNAPLAGTLAITFDDGYLDNFEEARPILLRHELPATFFISTAFIGTDLIPWWDEGIQPPLPWMRWEHITQLQADGFDIGGHTRTHVDLGQVKGAEAWAEISGSRDEIARRLGNAPQHFAFPYGRPENLIEENRVLVQEAGFACCVSCHGGTVRHPADPFRLQRVPVSAWYATPQQFALEVAAGRV